MARPFAFPFRFLLGLTFTHLHMTVSLRDVDPAEKEAVRQLGLRAYTMTDIDRLGIGAVMEDALQYITRHGSIPLHLSVDIDAIDPFLVGEL